MEEALESLKSETRKRALRNEIKALVQMIMDPSSTDDQRTNLGITYESKRLEFISLGGTFDEVLTKDGWQSI